MNKRNKKILILLIVITIVSIILFNLLKENTIYLGSNTKVYIVGNNIIKKYSNKEIKLRRVNIYKNDKIIKGYLKSEESDNGYDYYLISSNNKRITVDNIFASGHFIKMNNIPSKYIQDSINNKLLSEINEQLDLNLSIDNVIDYKKITYDLDNDSDNEEVVFIIYLLDNDYHTTMFINDNNYIEILDDSFDYSNPSEKAQKMYNLESLIDLNNDEYYEIIVSRIDGNSQPTLYDIYSYKNGNLKEIR